MDRARQQYDAAGEPRALRVVPECGHGGYLQAQPEEYDRQVSAILSALIEP